MYLLPYVVCFYHSPLGASELLKGIRSESRHQCIFCVIFYLECTTYPLPPLHLNFVSSKETNNLVLTFLKHYMSGAKAKLLKRNMLRKK